MRSARQAASAIRGGGSHSSRSDQGAPILANDPLMGGITSAAAEIYVTSPVSLQAQYKWGINDGGPYDTGSSTLTVYAAGATISAGITGLAAGTKHYWQLLYRRPGQGPYKEVVGSFYTARAAGTTYKFVTVADSHRRGALIGSGPNPWDAAKLGLYRLTLANALADVPDFLVDMGDTIHCEGYATSDADDANECIRRTREFARGLRGVSKTVPLVLVQGNHEGEQAWRYAQLGEGLPRWASDARLAIIPGYAGGVNVTAYGGSENLRTPYSFTWGDALHIVLEPYWFTEVRPHSVGGVTGTEDPWDWTLGKPQYDWLEAALTGNALAHIFVHVHQLVGGLPNAGAVPGYGRGSVEAVPYFEWGGKNEDESAGFAAHRPGWTKPIHDLLKDEADGGANVIAVLAHDHVYAHGIVDGVHYVKASQSANETYASGFQGQAGIEAGNHVAVVNNSGHLRWTVEAARVTCEYVRACLFKDQTSQGGGEVYDNGDVSDTWATDD